MRTGAFELKIRPKDRTAADEYSHRGRTWIEGRHNSHYVIDLVNHHNHMVEAVVSVDGLSVVDGQPAGFSSRGFVLQAGESATINGWQTTALSAAQFVFGSKEHSYGSRSGRGGNEGVIGVAWFLPRPATVDPIMPRGFAQTWHAPINSQPFDWHNGQLTDSVIKGIGSVSGSSVQASSMGTGWGPSVDQTVQKVTFVRASQEPTQVQLIYYDSATNLQKMGIVLHNRRRAELQQAFPGNSEGYCTPPPPDWTTKKW